MVLKLAHMVNPVVVGRDSELYFAQSITFESMRRARNEAGPELDVRIFSAQYAEDRPAVPADFEQTPDLNRSVLDLKEFKVQRKLPLLQDILDRLYHGSDADYLIFTNVDIGLQPHFYPAVHALIRSGFDSFVINRRTVPLRYAGLEDLEAIYADPGIPHPGWDCFVFPRVLCPHFVFHHACVGAGRVGLVLLANLVAFSSRFKEFRDEYLTFHMGDSRSWRGSEFAEYNAHNTAALMQVLADLEAERGQFERDSIPGRFIVRRQRFGAIYDLWSQHVYLRAQLTRLKNRSFRRG